MGLGVEQDVKVNGILSIYMYKPTSIRRKNTIIVCSWEFIMPPPHHIHTCTTKASPDDNDQDASPSVEEYTTTSTGIAYSTFVVLVTLLSVSMASAGVMAYRFSKVRKNHHINESFNEPNGRAETEVDAIA